MSAASVIILLLIAFVAFRYISSIASGSQEGSVPEDCDVIEANGHSFSVRTSGDKLHTPVILLHGFPESSIMWTNLMSDLNDKGYYTVAPDQRGYSPGARPGDVNQYKISYLVDDVLAIADALGLDSFHLIAHDWGSGVGWVLAANHANRVLSYSCMSVPHPSALSRAYREDKEQYEASSYVRGFQSKIIPEYMLARKDYRLLRSIWSDHSDEEIVSYLELFRQKNSLTAALNWYRANMSVFTENIHFDNVSIPVLFLWGNKDMALRRSGVEWTKDYVEGYYRFEEMEAGHWLIQESYRQVYEAIVEHLEQSPY